ncbi:MAG: thermonuclease family protein [Parahaliea sp.]
MKRPPFRRHERNNTTTSQAPPQLARWVRGLGKLAILAVAFTAWQQLTQGEVTWPGQLVERVNGYLSRSEAGWRHAADALEKQGERRDGEPVQGFDIEGRVVRVADGDTLSVLDASGEQHKVRLFAVDAPELAQSGGEQARDTLDDLIYQREVGVVVVDRDNYGRVVGTVYASGENINLAMVAAGQAWWYRYHAPYERALERAQEEARSSGSGLWARSNPQAPWDWRRDHQRR